MLEDTLNSIKAHIYDRTVSPLMGSIVVSWLAWNYKLPLLLFSKEPILEKFRIINEVLYSTNQDVYLNGCLYPLVTAGAYLFLYPFPAEYVYKFTRTKQKNMSDIKKKIEGETLLTVDESRRIHRAIDEAKEKHLAEIDSKNAEIKRLQDDIVELRKDNKTVEIQETAAEAYDYKVKPEEELLLERLTKNGLTKSGIIGFFDADMDNNTVMYHIGNLENNGLIELDNNDVYQITYEGRKYIIEVYQKKKNADSKFKRA